VKYALQSDVKPPRFALYVNNPDFFDRAYVRYLSNALRDVFEFPGSVLRIELRSSPAGRRAETLETPRRRSPPSCCSRTSWARFRGACSRRGSTAWTCARLEAATWVRRTCCGRWARARPSSSWLWTH